MTLDLRRIDVEAAVKALGIEGTKIGTQIVARCPNSEAHHRGDKKPSWAIRIDPRHPRHGVHGCWSCGEAGTIVSLTAAVKGISEREAERWLESGKFRVSPPQPRPIEIVFGADGVVIPKGVRWVGEPEEWPTAADNYFLSTESGHVPADRFHRRVPLWQVRRWGIGCAVDGRLLGRIWIPLWARDGRLRGWTARSFLHQAPKYLDCSRAEGRDPASMFGELHWPSRCSDEAIVVTEGELNALAVERVLGSPVVAIGGATLDHLAVLRLALFARVVVMTDSDEAGDDAADRLIEALPGKAVRARLPSGVDADEASAETIRETVRASLQRG